MTVEITSLIISIAAFIVSIVSIIITFYQNKDITSLNLQARYFEKIFDKYQDKQSDNIKEIGNKITIIYQIINTYSTGLSSH